MHDERAGDGADQPVEIVEVAARDGLQSDPSMLDSATKVELITRAVAAGIRRVEAVSFVNPTRVPQMADAEAVMAALPRDVGASYIGLVLNRRGFDRAVEAGVDEINVVVVVTDTFAERNQGTDTDGLVAVWADIAGAARQAGLFTSVTLSASFGCPYEGEVAVSRLVDVAERVAAHAPDELALADSIGVAVPTDVARRVDAVRDAVGDAIGLRCHFHNTRNTGLANAVAAVESGVRVLDSSLGGVGGCPFAPNATGNIPTEDLVYLLERMGHDTGVDLDALVATVPWMERVLEHSTPGLLAKAGVFPAR
jgi:hydroxymethylglutaryl-CoA lyase